MIASQFPISNALAFDGELFGMIASYGDEAHDKDMILSHRVENTISFKYCSATTKEGTPTAVAEYRKLIFQLQSSARNEVSLQKFRKDLFENNEICQIMGEPIYGINKDRFFFERQYSLLSVGQLFGGFLGTTFFFTAFANYSVSKTDLNTTTFLKRFSSNRKLRIISAISLINFLVFGASAYLDNEEIQVATTLREMNSLLYSKEAKITDLTMTKLKLNVEKAISIAVENHTLVPL